MEFGIFSREEAHPHMFTHGVKSVTGSLLIGRKKEHKIA
jgi:hypothetical protein